MDLRHLRRETRTALELAILALAPTPLVDRLAAVSGLLEALTELPAHSAPALALAASTADRARHTLAEWRVWEANHKKLA